MKIIQTSFFRAVCAIIIGALLIKYREETLSWITITIGVLFALSGLISCIIYCTACKHAEKIKALDNAGQVSTSRKPMPPLTGVASIILGLALAVMPQVIIPYMVHIFGGVLVICAIGQFVSLAKASNIGKVQIIFWLFPSVILLIGIVALFRQQWIASAPLFIIGWTMILYGVVECINTIKIISEKKKSEKKWAAVEAANQAKVEADMAKEQEEQRAIEAQAVAPSAMSPEEELPVLEGEEELKAVENIFDVEEENKAENI